LFHRLFIESNFTYKHISEKGINNNKYLLYFTHTSEAHVYRFAPILV